MQINTPCANGGCPELGGFVASYATRNPPPADLSMVMGYYTADALPVYDFFAKNFTVCDSWFAPLPTGTQPNRLMAMAGESAISDNVSGFLPEQSLAYDWLTTHGASWCVYQSGGFFPFFSLMPKWLPEIVTSLALPLEGSGGRFRRYSRFKADWTNSSNLPRVIFIEPEYTDGPHRVPNDDHPPTGVAPGQAFLADIYQTISATARWNETLMIVTYDEHGGFFDHVSPLDISTDVAGYQFQTTGLRVPAFLISPYVVPGGVFSGDLDHTSILQLLADKFNAGGTYSAPVSARTQATRPYRLPSRRQAAPRHVHKPFVASRLRSSRTIRSCYLRRTGAILRALMRRTRVRLESTRSLSPCTSRTWRYRTTGLRCRTGPSARIAARHSIGLSEQLK
jgi:phospholipase C